MYLVFTRIPCESCCRRLRSLLSYLCYMFRALINFLVCWFCSSSLGLVLFQICDIFKDKSDWQKYATPWKLPFTQIVHVIWFPCSICTAMCLTHHVPVLSQPVTVRGSLSKFGIPFGFSFCDQSIEVICCFTLQNDYSFVFTLFLAWDVFNKIEPER